MSVCPTVSVLRFYECCHPCCNWIYEGTNTSFFVYFSFETISVWVYSINNYLPGIEYLYEEQDIMSQALKIDASSICAFCSRMKRGRLYAAARRHGYNVLALGQHLDDISESFLMSIFHNGRLRTMKEMITIYINRLKRAKAKNQ